MKSGACPLVVTFHRTLKDASLSFRLSGDMTAGRKRLLRNQRALGAAGRSAPFGNSYSRDACGPYGARLPSQVLLREP
jgi:hypothetical protein